MKFCIGIAAGGGAQGRTPHGVRGLKSGSYTALYGPLVSHPTRGAWIEMRDHEAAPHRQPPSHPTRGAWIEIKCARPMYPNGTVAPHTGCVD